jgi:uncharacterized protein (UPF0335 family)
MTPPDFTCPNGHRIPERRFDPAIGCVVTSCTYRGAAAAEPEPEGEPGVDRGGADDDAGEGAGPFEAPPHLTALRRIVANIEAWVADRDDINASIREEKKEAKELGFNVKALNELLRRRAMDPQLREQMDQDLSLYELAVGLSGGTIDGGVLAVPALPAPPEPVEKALTRAAKGRRAAMLTASLAAAARGDVG